MIAHMEITASSSILITRTKTKTKTKTKTITTTTITTITSPRRFVSTTKKVTANMVNSANTVTMLMKMTTKKITTINQDKTETNNKEFAVISRLESVNIKIVNIYMKRVMITMMMIITVENIKEPESLMVKDNKKRYVIISKTLVIANSENLADIAMRLLRIERKQ